MKTRRVDPARAPLLDRTLLFGLALAVLAVYAQVVRFDFVLTDDPGYVVENPHVLGGPTPANLAWALTSFEVSNWHPLTWISLMLDARVGGGAPWAFHATNLALHAADTLLLYWLLLTLTGARWPSAAVAALFGLHPLHVESVAWVTERKDVLSTLFGLLAVLAWVAHVRRPGALRRAVAILAFALSLMAKPMLVTLPFLLLLLDYWPLGRWSDGNLAANRRLVLEKLPLFALSGASCWLTLAAQRGVVGGLEHFPLGLRLSNAVVSYATYLREMVWPFDLALPYPYDRAPAAAVVWGSAALLAGISALVLWRRRRRYLTVGWLWYLGTLVPVIGLVQVGVQPLADRYTYVPLVGPFVMLAWGLPDLLGNGRGRRAALGGAAVVALAGLGATARTQAGTWRDSRSLFEHALAVTADNVLAHNGLATVLARAGQSDAAIAHYRESLRIDPSAEYARGELSSLLVAAGRSEEAVALYRSTLEAHPDRVPTRLGLADLLLRLGRLDQAAAAFEAALRLVPDHAPAHIGLGNALARLGDAAGAAEHFRRAIALEPDHAAAHLNLAIVLTQQDRLDEARAELKQVLRLSPQHPIAHKRLGVVLYRQGRIAEALAEFEESLRLDPRQAELRQDVERLREQRQVR